MAEELRTEWEESQTQKIKNLEKLYLASLRNMGEGHQQAKENVSEHLFDCLSVVMILVKSRLVLLSSVQSLSRVRLFATPMNRSTPGLPVHHQLQFTQTHVHRVGDAIQPSHPPSSPSPPAPSPSQHQGLFQ